MTVTPEERRWALRHPLRWIGYFAVHLVVASMLWAIAASITGDAFSTQLAYGLWPIFLGGAGACALLSAVAPFEPRVQAVTGAVIGAAGIGRVVTYALFIAEGGATGLETRVAWSLLCHWAILAALGPVWPRLSHFAGTRASVAAGRDDRRQGSDPTPER